VRVRVRVHVHVWCITSDPYSLSVW